MYIFLCLNYSANLLFFYSFHQTQIYIWCGLKAHESSGAAGTIYLSDARPLLTTDHGFKSNWGQKSKAGLTLSNLLCETEHNPYKVTANWHCC